MTLFAPLARMLACLACAVGLVGTASAQGAWPAARPIRFIAPFAPGGPLDQTARVIAPKLAEALGQSVIVENVAGAGSTLGIAKLAQSAPDGYTIAIGHVGSLAIGPHLYPKAGYDPNTSFAPITMLGEYANVLVVNASEPYRNVQELIDAARAQPGKLTYGSAGNGSSNHLSGALLESTASVQLTHVPFRGTAPAMTELLAGRLSFMFDVLLNSMPHIQSGRLRALAVTNRTGIPQLPGVPPVAQTLPGYEVLGWVCLIAPAGTPQPVVERLNAELARIAKLPDVVAGLARVGFDATTSSPQDLAALIRKDYAYWGPVVKASGAKVD